VAPSASRKIVARWVTERALSNPPTILKWGWNPLRKARNVTPVF
jgi:hypothetical protein